MTLNQFQELRIFVENSRTGINIPIIPQGHLFNNIKAVDECELYDLNIAFFDEEFPELKDEELQEWFQPSNFCLITSNGHKHGPFGTNLRGRKPITIPIHNGNVLAQASFNFIYPDDFNRPVYFSNEKCFSFLVSFHIKRSRAQ